MTATAKEREEFAHIMGREGMPLDAARRIRRLAASYQSLAERACNEPLDEEWLSRKRLNIANAIGAILNEYNGNEPWHKDWKPRWSVCFNNDPRGATVKLKVPSGYTNDWGQEGVCVPA